MSDIATATTGASPESLNSVQKLINLFKIHWWVFGFWGFAVVFDLGRRVYGFPEVQL